MHGISTLTVASIKGAKGNRGAGISRARTAPTENPEVELALQKHLELELEARFYTCPISQSP